MKVLWPSWKKRAVCETDKVHPCLHAMPNYVSMPILGYKPSRVLSQYPVDNDLEESRGRTYTDSYFPNIPHLQSVHSLDTHSVYIFVCPLERTFLSLVCLIIFWICLMPWAFVSYCGNSMYSCGNSYTVNSASCESAFLYLLLELPIW